MSPDRLTPDQLKAIGEKLRRRGVPARCSVCSRADMTMMPAPGTVSLPGWDSPEYPVGAGNAPSGSASSLPVNSRKICRNLWVVRPPRNCFSARLSWSRSGRFNEQSWARRLVLRPTNPNPCRAADHSERVPSPSRHGSPRRPRDSSREHVVGLVLQRPGMSSMQFFPKVWVRFVTQTRGRGDGPAPGFRWSNQE